MSINRAIVSGNLTRDPDLKATAGGTSILTFGMAVNDRRKNPQTGEWEEVPNYLDVTVFGARAEPLSRFLSKGTKVCVEGKLRWSSWEKDGERRSKIEIIADEIEFLSPRNDQQPQQQYAPQQQAPQYAPQQYAPQYQQQPPQYAPQQYQQPPQQYVPQQQALYPNDIEF